MCVCVCVLNAAVPPQSCVHYSCVFVYKTVFGSRGSFILSPVLEQIARIEQQQCFSKMFVFSNNCYFDIHLTQDFSITMEIKLDQQFTRLTIGVYDVYNSCNDQISLRSQDVGLILHLIRNYKTMQEDYQDESERLCVQWGQSTMFIWMKDPSCGSSFLDIPFSLFEGLEPMLEQAEKIMYDEY